MPGYPLCKAVEWVESVAGEWCRDFPHVVLLMYMLVDETMMECAVEPIVGEVGEDDKADNLDQRVQGSCKLNKMRYYFIYISHLQ